MARGREIAGGAVALADLATNSVSSAAIVTDAVKGSEIADSSIDSGEVINNTLTTADIAGTDVNGGLVSFAAGSVANGRCEDHPVATGGAKVGEAAVITTQGTLPQGMLLYATRVPSIGTVTMKVCNITGGTMPAITNLPIRTITFG